MSVNNLLSDPGVKGWANLYVNTLTTYNGLNVRGTTTLEDFDINNINPGPTNTVLATDNTDQVVWEPLSTYDENIYNNDGTVTENRTVDCDNNNLQINNASDLVLNANNDITAAASNDMLLSAGGQLNLGGAVNLNDPLTLDNTQTNFLTRDGTGEIKYRHVSSVLTGYGRRIVVAQSGGDYTDIQSALTAASALTPAAGNAVHIDIYSGTYDQANDSTLTVPDFVNLFGFGQAIISRSAGGSNNPIIELGTNSLLRGITINANGNDGTLTGFGALVRFNGNFSGALNSTFLANNPFSFISCANANHFLLDCRFLYTPIGGGSNLTCVAASSAVANLENLEISRCVFRNFDIPANERIVAIQCDNNLGNYDISDCIFNGMGLDTATTYAAIVSDGIEYVLVNNCLFKECGRGIYCRNASANNYIHSCDFVDTVISNINVDSSAKAFISDCTLDASKLGGDVTTSNFDGVYYDNTGSTGYNFNVGSGITFNNVSNDNSTTQILTLDGSNKLNYRTSSTLFSKVGYSGRIATGSISYTTGSPIDLPYSVTATGSYTHGGVSWSGVLNHVVIPSGEPLRIYNISANVFFDNTTAGWGYGEIRILLNGSIAAADLTYIEAGRLGGIEISHNIELSANDIIKVQFSSSVNGDVIANNGDRMCKFSFINVA